MEFRTRGYFALLEKQKKNKPKKKRINLTIDVSDKNMAVRSVKKFVSFVYNRNQKAITEEYIDILSMTRKLILICGSFVINPLLAIPVFIADRFIEEEVNAVKLDNTISKLIKEIKTMKEKLEKEENEDKKKDIKEYISNLEKAKEKLEDERNKNTKKTEKQKENENADEEDEDDYFKDDYDDVDFELIETKNPPKFNKNNGKEVVSMVCEKSVIAMLTCDKILMTEKYFDTSSDFILTESTTKVKQKIKDSTRKMKKVDSKVSGKIDKSYFSLISNIKKAIAGDDPEVLIGNKGKKLSSYIKKFIGIGAGFLIAPALSGISLITALIMSKKVKDSEKQKLLHELKDELRICEEKIKDAENEGDKKKKYRLMRIENKLNKDIEKIRYGKYIDKDRK